MSVFGGLEDNAPDGSIFVEPGQVWNDDSIKRDTLVSRQNAQLPGVEDPTAGVLQKRRRKRLHVTVTHIELTKTDPVLWFTVEATLPRFRPSYKDVRRTHQELKRFANHLACANPECFVPALPGPSNSYKPTESEHSEKLKRDLQKWFDRVTRSPLLMRDDEFLYFTEATTGYVPVVKIKPPATGLARKMIKQLQPPPDEVDELRDFRPRAKLLYQYSGELRQRLERVSRIRKQLGAALQRFAVETRELHDPPQLASMWGRVARSAAVTGDTEFKKVEAEDVTIGDTMELVGREGYIIKETLTNRHLLMRDLIKSQSATQEYHQKATRLKGAANISPAKVDSAITQLEAAAHLERRITTTVRRVSDNLVAEKQLALARIEVDVLDAISTYVLQFIDQDRRVLAAWENTRPEVRAADPRHSGGLGSLGREGPVSPRRSRLAQNRSGDDWSDRDRRANSFAPAVAAPGTAEVLDHKAAALILTSGVTFQ